MCETGNRNSDRPLRRRTGQDTVSAVKLPEQMTADVDIWAEAHHLTRADALRRLIELGLKAVSAAPAPGPAHYVPAGIEDLVAKQIGEMLDPSLAPEERERRIRRLTEGPPEFSQLRVDLPKHDK